MSTPIFETNYFGSKVKVYPTYVTHRFLFGPENSIPINQIASIELGIPLLAQIIIETTGGKKYKVLVTLGQKKKLRDTIYSLLNGSSS